MNVGLLTQLASYDKNGVVCVWQNKSAELCNLNMQNPALI